MMKKQFLFLPLAALTLGLAACSEQADFTQADVVNAAIEQKDDPVNFGVYVEEHRDRHLSLCSCHSTVL